MSESALISVILPIYKVEKYIRECLESLEKQTYKNIEVFCVDDCGNDNSIPIAEEFAQRDSRFKIIHNPHNLGIGPSRNQGLNNAKGEYIFFVDPDDYLKETALEDLYNNMQETNSDIVVTKAFAFADDDSKETTDRTKSINLWLNKKPANKHKVNVSNYTDAIFNFNCTIWGKLYRRSFFEKNNIRFINKKVVHEDNGFWLKICSCFPTLTYIDKVGLMYRIRKNATTDTINRKGNEHKKYVQMRRNILDAFKFVKKHAPKEYRKELLTQIANSPEYSFYMESNIKCLYRFKWLKNQKYIYLFGIPFYTEKQKGEGIKKRKILGIVIKEMELEQIPININFDEIKLEPITKKQDVNFKTYNNDKNIQSALNFDHFYFYPAKGDFDNLMFNCASYQYIQTMNYNVFDILKFKTYKEPFNMVYGSSNIWKAKYKKEQKDVLKVFKSPLIKKCVILPSSFNDCPELMSILDDRFTVFCQDKKSYDYCTGNNTKAQFILAENMLINANLDIFKTDFYNGKNIERFNSKEKSELKVLTDKIYPYYKEKTMMTLNAISKYDTHKAGYLLYESKEHEEKFPDVFDLATLLGSYCCDEGLTYTLGKLYMHVIDNFNLIVTDRVNIAITASKLGKKVLLLKNDDTSAIYNETLKNWKDIYITDEKNIETEAKKLSENQDSVCENSILLPKDFNEFLYQYASFMNKYGIEQRIW